LLAAVPVRRIDATTITQLAQGLVELDAHLIELGEGRTAALISRSISAASASTRST
jgi:hypothetical protein